eukprot:1560057-Rhodomonas_salina.1
MQSALSAYAVSGTKRAYGTSAMDLHACYAKPGTNIACFALPAAKKFQVRRYGPTRSYAMSGTERAHAGGTFDECGTERAELVAESGTGGTERAELLAGAGGTSGGAAVAGELLRGDFARAADSAERDRGADRVAAVLQGVHADDAQDAQ